MLVFWLVSNPHVESGLSFFWFQLSETRSDWPPASRIDPFALILNVNISQVWYDEWNYWKQQVGHPASRLRLASNPPDVLGSLGFSCSICKRMSQTLYSRIVMFNGQENTKTPRHQSWKW
jgi:hypothetical protein